MPVGRKGAGRIPYRLARVERQLDGVVSGGGGGGGDHGALTGLADDDHAQYHNDARGDARYTPLAHAAHASDASLRDRATHTGTQSADTVVDGTTNKAYTATEQSKLAGIATGATANSTDASLRDRATHTGTQTASTISDLTETIQDMLSTFLVAGTNITLTYNDGSNTLTVAASGGGSSPVSTKALSADVSNSTTTGAKLTDLDTTLAVGNYHFKYVINYHVAASTTGVKFGVNFTGTKTRFAAQMEMPNTGLTAIATTHDQQTSTDPQIMGVNATRNLSSTAPDLGPIQNTDSATADMLTIIEGHIVVTVSGDLQLYHASEIAASTTVKQGSGLILTKMG